MYMYMMSHNETEKFVGGAGGHMRQKTFNIFCPTESVLNYYRKSPGFL